MLKTIAIGIVLVGATIAIHAVGSFFWFEYLLRRHTGPKGRWKSGSTLRVLLFTGFLLMVLHLLEALLWATAFYLLPLDATLKTFEGALYFSIVTFTTLGYGDITLDPQWRLLSGIEAMNGILLAGWSTALLFTVVQRSWKLSHHGKQNH